MATKINGSVKITTDYNNSGNRNIPKIITYFFLISQFISGLDFGFPQALKDNVRIFFRIFTILEICTYSVIIFTPLFVCPTMMFYIAPMILYPFFEYVLNASILFCTRKYNVYVFMYNISQFCNLTKHDKFILYLISIVNFLITLFLKAILVFMLDYNIKTEPHCDGLPFYYYMFVNLYYIFVDLVSIAQIFIFYYIYSSMKHLKLMLMLPNQKLRFVLFRYKAIVDTRDKIRPLSDTLVSYTFF